MKAVYARRVCVDNDNDCYLQFWNSDMYYNNNYCLKILSVPKEDVSGRLLNVYSNNKETGSGHRQ